MSPEIANLVLLLAEQAVEDHLDEIEAADRAQHQMQPASSDHAEGSLKQPTSITDTRRNL